MRKLCSIALAAAVGGWSQAPPDTAEFRAAKQAIEAWMGCPLSLYEDRTKFPAAKPKEPQFGETAVTLSMKQLLTFESGQELAESLAHGAAHVRRGHSAKLATLSKAMGILGADRSARVLQAETRAEIEEEAKAMAAELMKTAGCDPGPCPMFDALLKTP